MEFATVLEIQEVDDTQAIEDQNREEEGRIGGGNRNKSRIEFSGLEFYYREELRRRMDEFGEI